MWNICRRFLIKNDRLFITHFRFVKGRRNQNDSISADPAVRKKGPVLKTWMKPKFNLNPILAPPGENFKSYFSTHCG